MRFDAHNIFYVVKNKIVGKDMKTSKLLSINLLVIAFVVLAFWGFAISPHQNTTARADDSMPITVKLEYNIISTSDTVYVKNQQDNTTFVDVVLDKTNRTLSNALDESGNTVSQVSATVTTNNNIIPTTDQYGTTQASTLITLNDTDNTNFSLSNLYINNMIIDSSVGWLYETNVGDTITLSSIPIIQKSNGDREYNQLTYNFVTTNFTEDTTDSRTYTLRIYCIVNPYVVNLFSGSLGTFQQDETGNVSGVEQIQVNVPYLQNMTFSVPTPTNNKEYKFEGFYTTDNTKVTNEAGVVVNEDNSPIGWKLGSISLYAHYVEVINITYYFNYNNEECEGTLQFEKSDNIDKSTLEQAVKNNKLIVGNSTNSYAFPTDKNIAKWYTDEAMTTLQTFPLSGQDYTLYIQLAELQYNIVFDVSPGEFWDNTTAKTYTVDFGSTVASALSTLRSEVSLAGVSTTAFATRTGYQLGSNGQAWALNQDSTSRISLNNTIIENDLTIYVIWEKCKYTVNFMTDGSISSPSATVDYQTNLTDFLDSNSTKYTPTNTGFNFIGWAFSTSDSQNSYYLNSRPTTNTVSVNGATLTMLSSDDTMPNQNIRLYGVWIQAYTVKFALNKGSLSNDNLTIKDSCIIFTIENGETLNKAITRMGISDFFTSEQYKPKLENCKFAYWCYYADGDYGNNDPTNTYALTDKVLDMNVSELLAHNIDITKDATIAARYNFDTSVSTYTTAPSDTTNIIFAVILVIISITLLVLLIITHKNNSTIEINDKAIDAYKHKYGEDAPLPTFEATKPPFEQSEDNQQNPYNEQTDIDSKGRQVSKDSDQSDK